MCDRQFGHEDLAKAEGVVEINFKCFI